MLEFGLERARFRLGLPAIAAIAALVTGCGSNSSVAAVSVGGSAGTPNLDSSTALGGSSNSASSGNNGASSGSAGTHQNPAPNVLVFSRTVGYRHSSIEPAIRALAGMARERGFSLTATEDPATFSANGLANFDVVLFLSTTGDVLNEEQQVAFEAFIRGGRGFVGVHAASDTEYDWPWYGGLVGAYFRNHPEVQRATLLVEDVSHPATAQLPTPWTRTDEWYSFRDNPRTRVKTLLRLDESTYEPGESSMDADHPIAWYHEYDGGRAFYTGLGHTDESYQEPAFLEHLWGGIEWAASR
ncbi:MAG TPA: ThuA domain-containing protein [Polyangiaceae bacterium]